MWAAIRNDAERRARFLAERYYVEDFSSGTCPAPYRAYHRVKVALHGKGSRRRIVVNRQSFVPGPRAGDAGGGRPSRQFFEQELIFDGDWRFLRARQWSWGQPDPGRFGAPETLTYGGGSAEGMFYGSDFEILSPGTWWAARLVGDEVVAIREGEAPRTFAIDPTRPPAIAVKLLVRLAPEAVGKAPLRYWLWQDGCESDYDFSTFTKEPTTLNGKPALRFEVPQMELTIVPATGEYRYWLPQLTWVCSVTTKEAYFSALRAFLDDFGISELADAQGRPVALPLGLKGLGAEVP